MKKTLVLLALTVALLAQAPTRLTLREAEDLALKNHPQVLGAQNEQSAMNQKITETRSAYFPQVFGDSTTSQGNIGARIGAGYLTDSRLFNRQGDGITFTQLLYDSGRTSNLVASSRLEASAAGQNVEATKFDVLLRVNQAYYGTLRAQALVKVAQSTVQARQYLTDQITTMRQNNLKSDVDVDFADVELARAKLLLLQSQADVQAAYAELTRAIGAEDAATYQVSDEPMPPSPSPNAEDLVQQALKARPELASLTLSRDAAYKFERAERDLSLPNAGLIGVGGYQPYVDQITPPHLVPNEYEGIGLNIQLPVFNGGLFKARREEAHYRAMEADQRLRDEAQIIARDVRAAWSNASIAYQRMDVTAQMLTAASAAESLAQQRYQLGLSTIVEVTDAELNLTSAQVDVLNAKYDYQTQYAALQYAIGALR